MSQTRTDGDHAVYEKWAAAYALGALESADRVQFEAHLAGCVSCRREMASLAPLPGLLVKAGADDLESTIDPTVSAQIEALARREFRSVARRERAWRGAAVVAAAAALLLGIVAVAGDGVATAEAGVPARVVALEVDTASVATITKGWGTEIEVELGGLPERRSYTLWVVDAQGEWSPAASWGPTPSGRAVLTGATHVPTKDLDRIVVTSTNRTDVLVDATVG